MSDDLRKITERVQVLEARVTRMARIIACITGWFSRGRKANAVSRHLSGPEVVQLKAQMAAHGMEDEDSRREKAAS